VCAWCVSPWCWWWLVLGFSRFSISFSCIHSCVMYIVCIFMLYIYMRVSVCTCAYAFTCAYVCFLINQEYKSDIHGYRIYCTHSFLFPFPNSAGVRALPRRAPDRQVLQTRSPESAPSSRHRRLGRMNYFFLWWWSQWDRDDNGSDKDRNVA